MKGGLNNEIFVSWIKHIWFQLLCGWSIQINLSHLKMCQYLGSVWLLFFFFWNTLILLFSKDALNWIKSYSKDIYNVTKYVHFKSLLFLLTFYSSVNPEKIKYITVSIKIFCSTTVFNIDNNHKCFLSSKSVYYYDFWRSCDSEDWSNDADNSAAHHRNILHFTIYSHRKQLF